MNTPKINRHKHPFAAGFVQGVTNSVEMTDRAMRHTAPNVTVQDLAADYGVSSRTIHRWKKAGVDVVNPLAVAKLIQDRPQTTLKSLVKVSQLLNK